ncbi:MAG: hypothetical protein MUC69_00300 [Gemmatimonadales bacterium]|nr:hypothetical protein [Gemmatimonadales bacterium]
MTSRALILVALVALAAGTATAETTRLDARLDLMHLTTIPNDGALQNRSELRVAADAHAGRFELHLDGRVRWDWEDGGEVAHWISQAYVQYDPTRRVFLALGRQVIPAAAAARVDGLHLGLRVGDTLVVGVFGGLMPHPLTNEWNADFATAGLDYDVRGRRLQNQGGVVFQLFGADLDRVYLTERLAFRPSPQWTLFGFALVDLLAVQPASAVSGASLSNHGHVDLTSGQAMVRFAPVSTFDLTLTGGHTHSVLPTLWWRSWVEEQRLKRGLVIDGPLPVGTRRTSGQLVANLRLGRVLWPYASFRYDYRHEDDRQGFDARGGLKLLLGARGYAEVAYSYRRFFVVDNQLAEVRGEVDVTPALTLDLGLAVMHSRPLASAPGDGLQPVHGVIFDGEASVWVHFGGLSRRLRGLDLQLLYQAFVEPGVLCQIAMARLSYRLRR